MKKFTFSLLIAFILFSLNGCKKTKEFDGTIIQLSDSKITVNGSSISNSNKDSVYKANDIVFYLEGQGFKYGEGTEADEHTQKEADSHTVVHITKPGNYKLSGSLSKGQIAIDLGDDAKDDPNAVVNLYLDNIDINCDVAPAVIFYNVYECGSTDETKATYNVDTSKAGANVYIMDKTKNNVNGSYVARIYDEITLSDEGTEVIDNKKLHKYDGAFYSKQTMNINGGNNNSGELNITAENEGLDSELHLTINGGNINITSGNDGINTNEDGISVTTINGGNLSINVTGETGEGDGIDSNGWLVINGGSVTAAASSKSGDAGIDSDNGIYIYGGTVKATGNMLDKIAGSGQNYAVFSFANKQTAGSTYTLKDENNNTVFETTPVNDFSYLIISSTDLNSGNYTLWNGDTQLGYSGNNMNGGPGGFGGRKFNPGEFEPKEGETFPERPDGNNKDFNPREFETKEGETFPERKDFKDGKRPSMAEGEPPTIQNGEMPSMAEGETPKMPDGEPPAMQDNNPPEKPEGEVSSLENNENTSTTINNLFEITNGGNIFSGITKL